MNMIDQTQCVCIPISPFIAADAADDSLDDAGDPGDEPESDGVGNIEEEVDKALIAAEEGVVGLDVEAVEGDDDESCHARPAVGHKGPYQPTAKEI